MKQFIYFFLIIVFFSCSNRKDEKHPENTDIFESLETASTKDLTTHKYQGIAAQKLQNYVELLKLKEKHPELKEDIQTQLNNVSKKAIISISEDATIENIYQVGPIETISDTIQKIKLVYTLISKTKRIEDTLYATIKSTTIILDGSAIKANKVTFSKE